VRTTKRRWQSLSDYCLVTRAEDDRLTIHELVRAFARIYGEAADGAAIELCPPPFLPTIYPTPT